MIKMFNAKSGKLRKNEIIFLISALVLPILQFILFYVVVNFNSFALSFKSTTDGVHFKLAGFDNYKLMLRKIFNDVEMGYYFRNSLVMYLMTQLATPTLCLFFSFAFWKKVLGTKFFQSVLFLPSVISSVVFVMIFRNALNSLLPTLFKNDAISEWLNPYKSGFTVTTLFTCFLSFGGTMLLLLGAFSSIDQSVVEYARIDGVNTWQEFRYVAFPFIYPTLISMLIIGLSGFFSSQGHLITFYSASTDPQVNTIGTFIYITVYKATNYSKFPELSAMGIMLSLVAIAVTLTLRKVLEKYGPSED